MCIPGSDNELLRQVAQRVLAGTALTYNARSALQLFLELTQPWVPAVGDRFIWISGGRGVYQIVALDGKLWWYKALDGVCNNEHFTAELDTKNLRKVS